MIRAGATTRTPHPDALPHHRGDSLQELRRAASADHLPTRPPDAPLVAEEGLRNTLRSSVDMGCNVLRQIVVECAVEVISRGGCGVDNGVPVKGLDKLEH